MSAGQTADWNAETYHRVAANQEEWGLKVQERLDLTGDETVLDAGCGSGRVTAHLLERLPSGRVIGVDASPSMIEHARAVLNERGLADRVELIVANLLDLELVEEVDAIFSNAVFHWVLDHERLFTRLHDALRSGGKMEAQCGGQGNVAEFENVLRSLEGDERFGPYLRTMTPTWNFAGVGDTEMHLERAGFEHVTVWLEEAPVSPENPRDYVVATGLARHLERLPEPLRDPFVDAVMEFLPRPLTLNYVRLNISARRP
jgi:trans-aconitate 2-methyltransferase